MNQMLLFIAQLLLCAKGFHPHKYPLSPLFSMFCRRTTLHMPCRRFEYKGLPPFLHPQTRNRKKFAADLPSDSAGGSRMPESVVNRMKSVQAGNAVTDKKEEQPGGMMASDMPRHLAH
ncbi:MAG TPA: hypothetical protein H9744_08290 [Candidatus Eisenbergiella stercoravium]|nr:hypothetical protein [Candidatus Eisenbergiella stercoravium]